ncbi:MAG: transketolase C-terminal domain-containing protein [Actinomycetota bacterium]|nr:transketolase C-terminal domain-containing protein [Actinomycetota bacterium]
MSTPESREPRILTFAAAINEATHQAMAADPTVLCIGLGATDPGGVFGTTKGLIDEFGPSRVFDGPTSENAMTGIAVGAALAGLKPVMTHQRLDFFLLAMDQLINSAAKWHYMFGGQFQVPLTIRLIIGRGWGQGPTHSQNLQAWFAHIPGLKVVVPSSPVDAKQLLLSSIHDPNPVLFLEHRWLHNIADDVPIEATPAPLGKARLARTGDDLTIVTSGYLTLEAIRAADYLKSRGISCDVLDLRTLHPLDWPAVHASVAKTGTLLVLDSGALTGSISGEIVARVASHQFSQLKQAPRRLAQPDIPEPTSLGLIQGFHVRSTQIASEALDMLHLPLADVAEVLAAPEPADSPGDWFRGPF